MGRQYQRALCFLIIVFLTLVAASCGSGAGLKAPTTISPSLSGTPAAANSPAPAPAGGPAAPPNATVVSSIQDRPNWGKCSSPSCSGGVGTTSTYWMAQFQTTPSLSGSSSEFYIAGPAYTDSLFWNDIGANAAASHFLFDFYVHTDAAALAAAEALEFDLVQVVNGKKYNWSTECNYVYGVWDIWNEATQQWIHSNATCQKFTPGTWHHVQWLVERIGSSTHYISVTVDGVTQHINSNIATQPAPASNWMNSLIVQVQQDLSANPGNGFHEWADKITVSAW
ncbi:MAG: hypothetical protein ACE14M_03740 [Terriglobales bacterium]